MKPAANDLWHHIFCLLNMNLYPQSNPTRRHHYYSNCTDKDIKIQTGKGTCLWPQLWVSDKAGPTTYSLHLYSIRIKAPDYNQEGLGLKLRSVISWLSGYVLQFPLLKQRKLLGIDNSQKRMLRFKKKKINNNFLKEHSDGFQQPKIRTVRTGKIHKVPHYPKMMRWECKQPPCRAGWHLSAAVGSTKVGSTKGRPSQTHTSTSRGVPGCTDT